MSRPFRLTAALLVPTVVLAGNAAFAAAHVAAPGQGPGTACADLAAAARSGPDVASASSVVVTASGTAPAYCDVILVVRPAVTIAVGLPLNARDGGAGGAAVGAWNGRVINLGGGGYVGFLPDTRFAVARGEVGSGTDTGHNTAWCNAVNPRTGRSNAQPDCGLAGGGFVLDPAGKLLTGQVTDFIKRSLYLQTTWALTLSKAYYGRPAARNYWAGASTGGRQGWQMAQSYGDLFDGFLVGFPAMNWNRFAVGEAWPAVVVNELLGSAGLPPAKSAAANAAAVAACDRLDGAVDGLIAGPIACHYDARKLICTGAETCLTPAQATAINMIWDGPRDARGRQLWGGITHGTSFDVLLPGGTAMSPMIDSYLRYWLYQDPSFDWRASLSIANFPTAFTDSQRKFAASAATDSTDLSQVVTNNAKIIFYHGTNDPLITSHGSYEYIDRLTDRYGERRTRSFVRTFFYPGLGHTSPPLVEGDGHSLMLDALQKWVETGTAPESFTEVAGTNGAIKVCAHPDRAVVTGTSGGKPTYTCKRS
jgi:hypothetical protein